MVVGKCDLLARTRGFKDADNGHIPTRGVRPPTALWQSSLSRCSALRKWFKTASFRLSATSSASPLWQVKTDLDPRQNRSFGFRLVLPQKRGFGFGFKTDPGLHTVQCINVSAHICTFWYWHLTADIKAIMPFLNSQLGNKEQIWHTAIFGWHYIYITSQTDHGWTDVAPYKTIGYKRMCNTTEQNSSIFSLIQMHQLQSARACEQQNSAPTKSSHFLTGGAS